jgi:hypothetical protein
MIVAGPVQSDEDVEAAGDAPGADADRSNVSSRHSRQHWS